MSRRPIYILLSAVGCLLGSFQVSGQTDSNSPPATPAPDRSGRILAPEQAPSSFDFAPPPAMPGAATRVERPQLPPETKAKVERFERLREAYLENQRELTRKLRGATEQEREQIREQIKAARNEWLEKSQSLREDARERRRELLEKLPKHREALEEARDNARQQLRENRPRRGED